MSPNNYKDILNSLDELIIVSNLNPEIIFINNSAKEIYGNLSGEKPKQILKEKGEKLILTSHKSKRKISYQTGAINNLGKKLTIDWTISPNKNKIILEGIISNENIKLNINHINDPIYVVNENLDYIGSNDKYLKLRNLNSTIELCNSKYSDYHSPKKTKEFKQKVDEALSKMESIIYLHTKEETNEKYLRTLTPRINFVGKKEIAISSKKVPDMYQLADFITVCMFCNKAKDEKKEWIPMIDYLAKKNIHLSHGICNPCYEKNYANELNKLKQS